MTGLKGKRILLGVSGGIAAYKAPELVRSLQRAGAEVRVVLTTGGKEFVSPLALEVLTGSRVGLDLFDPTFEHEIGHIELARWADLLLIAPATANVLARMRAGAADDLLTTVALATRAPTLVCPAMNTQMWLHPAVQENVRVLESRGVHVLSPDSGVLACHEVGPGRLPDPPEILTAASRALAAGSLRGRKLCITAGPTREAFDPVRFLSNPSSGRMGIALAHAATIQGAEVTLILGPTELAPPPGCRVVRVTSAADMANAVFAEQGVDALVMSAAVADWTPADVAGEKRKKTEGQWTPTLERTRDILATVSTGAGRPRVVVGFAAETSEVEASARGKLERKALDGIVANQVREGQAFGSTDNSVLLIDRHGGRQELGLASKDEIAVSIVEWLAGLLEKAS